MWWCIGFVVVWECVVLYCEYGIGVGVFEWVDSDSIGGGIYCGGFFIVC